MKEFYWSCGVGLFICGIIALLFLLGEWDKRRHLQREEFKPTTVERPTTAWYGEDHPPIPNRQIGFRTDGVVVWRFATNYPSK